MAGWNSVKEANRPQNSYTWVKVDDLIKWKQRFCILAIEQDSFDLNGDPQYTININFVREGRLVNGAFNLKVTPGRERDFGQVKGAIHNLLVTKKALKKNPAHTFIEFEDAPGYDEGDPCACTGEGVFDENDPSTWTEHYKATNALHNLQDALDPTHVGGYIDTSNMDVAQIQQMVKMLEGKLK